MRKVLRSATGSRRANGSFSTSHVVSRIDVVPSTFRLARGDRLAGATALAIGLFVACRTPNEAQPPTSSADRTSANRPSSEQRDEQPPEPLAGYVKCCDRNDASACEWVACESLEQSEACCHQAREGSRRSGWCPETCGFDMDAETCMCGDASAAESQ